MLSEIFPPTFWLFKKLDIWIPKGWSHQKRLIQRRCWVPLLFPCPLLAADHVFFSLPFAIDVLVKSCLFPFIFLTKFNTRWDVSFLTPTLQDQIATLYSFWVIWPCFHLLYALYVWVKSEAPCSSLQASWHLCLNSSHCLQMPDKFHSQHKL